MVDAHVLANDYLLPALILFAGIVAYVFWVRPILKETPALRDLYAAEAGYIEAFKLKTNGTKQRLTTVVLSTGTTVAFLYDTIQPLATQMGITIAPAQYWPTVPTWVWPLVGLAALWLLGYFRRQADRAAAANAEALLNAGQPLAAPAPGLPVTTLPSPLPQKAG